MLHVAHAMPILAIVYLILKLDLGLVFDIVFKIGYYIFHNIGCNLCLRKTVCKCALKFQDFSH